MELVYKRFKDAAPSFVLMNFVNIEFGNTSFVHELNQVLKFMRPKPVMIQRDIECIIRIGIFLLDSLQQHSCFTYSTLSHNSNDA